MSKPRTSRRTVVGLDIEPSYVAAAEVRVNGRVLIERAASAPLDPGVMREGEVTDPEALGDALKAFFAEHGLSKRVRIGVANQRIVVRTIDLPRLDDHKQLAAAVRFQAQEHIPMPLDSAVLDFQAVGVVQGEGGERTRVVLVAARRDMIERVLTAARRAGLRPEGIDLSAFAMIRALGEPSRQATGATLYVSVGGLTNVAVAENGACRFTRVAAGGVEGIAAQLAERRGLTLEHARQWLSHVGLVSPIESLDGDQEIVAEARGVLADGVRRIAEDVRHSAEYYGMQEGTGKVERAILTGPAVGIAGFAEQLASEVGLPVESAVVSEARPGALHGLDAGRFTIAAGLAVEEAGG